LDALRLFFEPRSIAVVGTSRSPRIGHVILRNLLGFGYRGRLYAVNLKADSILGVKSYSSILDVSGEVDPAVVVVPAEKVVGALEGVEVKGVKVAAVITSSFGEKEGLLRRSWKRLHRGLEL